MLANHLCVHRVCVDVQRASDHVPQACRVEHRAGAEHARGRQARGLRERERQDVDRIGDHHDQAGVAAQCLGNAAHDGGILAREVEARLRGRATLAGGNDDRARIEHVVERGDAHGCRRQERAAVHQVHRLALSRLESEIVHEQLFRDAGVHNRDGGAGADAAHADDADASGVGHVAHCSRAV